MSNATQTFRTGMAFIGGSKVNSFSLEYMSQAGANQPGKVETIVVPYLEIGRSGTCGLQFYDDTPTVSRKHAAIKRDGDQYFLENLSETNPTLLNDTPIQGGTPLKNGDEIQLSYEGPKLRFNLKGDPKMGFTKRINLVAKQAVKPYKNALLTVIILFVVAGVLGAYMIKNLSKETVELTRETQQLKNENLQLTESHQQLQQTLISNKMEMETRMAQSVKSRDGELLNYQRKIDSLQNKISKIKNINPEEVVSKALEEVKNSVLYLSLVHIYAEYNGEVYLDQEQPKDCHCTGFLLNDGRFVTARHCVDFHAFDTDQFEDFNVLANNGGNIIYSFLALSPDGKIKLEFTSQDLIIDRSADLYEDVMYQDQIVTISKASDLDGKDWAVYNSDVKGNIQIDPNLAQELSLGTILHCLGYTYGSTYQDLKNNLSVLYSKASVAKDGLNKNTILVSGYSFDNGNSGGPLFVIKNGKATAVGIVSAGLKNPASERSDALGSVVPVSNLPN